MRTRWITDEETGREFRTIPMNLADRDRAIAPWTLRRLEREFTILWAKGLIWKDGGES